MFKCNLKVRIVKALTIHGQRIPILLNIIQPQALPKTLSLSLYEYMLAFLALILHGNYYGIQFYDKMLHDLLNM